MQHLEVDRLGEVIVEAGFARPLTIAFPAVSGHSDDQRPRDSSDARIRRATS